MTEPDFTPILLERETERLRQEREVFNQRKTHANRWFIVQVTMALTAIVLLAGIAVVASYILITSDTSEYPGGVLVAAGTGLFGDIVGLLIGIWKVVINPPTPTRLEPVTQASLPASLSVQSPQQLE